MVPAIGQTIAVTIAAESWFPVPMIPCAPGSTGAAKIVMRCLDPHHMLDANDAVPDEQMNVRHSKGHAISLGHDQVKRRLARRLERL